MSDIKALLSNGSITGSGSSSVYQRTTGDHAPLVSVSVATVTGTGPTLIPKLMHSVDGANFDLLATGSVLSASGQKTIFGPDTTKPIGAYLRVDYDVAGTTPSFTGVEIKLQLN